MANVEKKIPLKLLDTDTAHNLLPNGAAVNMRNIRHNNTITGKKGRFENMLRNMKLTGQEGKIPVGSDTVARCEDPAGKFIVWFTHRVANPDDDQINFYDLVNNKYWLVAKNVIPNLGSIIGGLGFQPGVFFDMEIVNGTIYWTSPNHRPRKIHIGAGIKACNPTSENIPFYEGWQYDWVNSGDDDTSIDNLSLAVKPPAYPPMIVKGEDSTVSENKLNGESYQFATQYLYHSWEESSLSMFSRSSQVNSEAEKDKNVIEVTINPQEYPIPQGVKKLRLYVKVESTNKIHQVHTWNVSDIVADGVASFKFYGNYYGVTLDDATANEPYHNVPDRSSTIEVIKNRLFLGNNDKGKDTPEKTSLKLTLGPATQVAGLENARKKLQRVMYRGTRKNGLDRPRFYYSGLFLKMEINEVSQPGYYLIPGTEIRMGSGFAGVPAIFAESPANVLLEDLEYKGTTLQEIIENTKSVNIAKLYESYIQESPTYTIEVIGLLANDEVIATNVFLYNADYIAGTAFYDRYMKKTGVVYNTNNKIKIPYRTFESQVGYTDMRWSLTNSDAKNEIPVDSVYYAPLLARNNRTSFFIEGLSIGTRYATLSYDGTYKFDDGKADGEQGNDDTQYLNYNAATGAIGIDTTSLTNAGLGYTFSKGDQCILIGTDNKIYHLPVIGIDGKYILLAAKDIGSLSNTRFIFQIYTPYKVAAQDYFYEVGQLYAVSEAGTENRKYSTLEGNFLGDVFVLPRKNDDNAAYLAYAMSPNDLYFEKWFMNFGRVNEITDLGKKTRPRNVCFSDVFIGGTKNNGLSAFHALNETDIPEGIGGITKLQAATKIQGEGNVLLAICEAGCVSVYIGEAELFDQNGNSFLAKSDKVIGQINPLAGGYGTRHPESVAQIGGLVFWYNHLRRSFVQYSNNGLYPISNYDFQSATIRFAQRIKELEAAGLKVLVNGGVDPIFNEYLVQVKVSESYVEPEECCIPIDLTITYEPTEIFPGKTVISWKQPVDQLNFYYIVMDKNLYPIANGSGTAQEGTGEVSLTFDYFIVGVNYTFQLRTLCGGNNNSSWVQKPIYVQGVEVPPTPGNGCVKPGFNDVIPGSANVGYSYNHVIELEGSTPMTISDLIFPSWMQQPSIIGNKVSLFGFPRTEDINKKFEIKFTVNNCSGEPLLVQGTVKVISISGRYDVRLAVNPGEICGKGTISVYADSAFGVGATLFWDQILEMPVQGYNFVDCNGNILIIDPVTGEILEDTNTAC